MPARHILRLRRRSWLALTAVSIVVIAAGAQLASQARQKPAADPHAAIRANNLGTAYMNQQKMEQALAEFERAYAADRKLAAARLNQGIALMNLQRIEPARAVLREVTARDTKNVRAWYNLGLLEKNAGDAEAALAAFEKVATLDSDDAHTHYFIGTLLSQLQRYPEAIAAFERAIALDRFHVSAEFGLARALQRTGSAEQARLHLARFQQLNTDKLGSPVSLAYGDQGPYSLAETVTLPPTAAAPPIPVKFTPVPAPESGLVLPPRPPKPLTPSEPPAKSFWEALGRALSKAFEDLPGALGPGACVLDFNRDGWDDVLIVGHDPVQFRLYRNANGKFVDATQTAGLGKLAGGLSCSVGDYDGDGWSDFVVATSEGLRLFANKQNRSFLDVSEATGLGTSLPTANALFWDFDHDGDLDIFAGVLFGEQVRPKAQSVLWRNNGNGTFTDWTVPGGLFTLFDNDLIAAAILDHNGDRAVDLVISVDDKPASILENEREGKFVAIDIGLSGTSNSTVAPTVLDFDRDGWTDVAFSGEKPQLARNNRGKTFDPLALPELGKTAGIASIDFDNDGWTDLGFASQPMDEGDGKLYLLRNQGKSGFKGVSEQTNLGSLDIRAPRAVVTLDFDNDGDADLLVSDYEGSPVLLRNDGGNKNNWLKLSLQGLADNKSAIGTKVEVFAGASYQKFEVQSSSGYLGQNSLDLLIGLGQEKQADVVRLLWPTGVVQDEVNLAANQRHVITEIDRRGSSCPVLFAWNGSRYEFIADAIGPGIVGHWVAPGVRNTSDPTEYIKVPGTLLRERSGPNGERRLSFRFAEPMEEIVYLDQLRLFAVDHPADSDVNPSERFYASGPPFPSGEPVFTEHARAHAPLAARDHRGRDVTALLRDADRRYVTEFADAPYKGFAELHWVELDLGNEKPRVGGHDFSRVESAAILDSSSGLQPLRGEGPSAAKAEDCSALAARLKPCPPGEQAQPRRSLAAPRMTATTTEAQPSTSHGATQRKQAAPLRLLLHGYTDYFTATSVYAAHQGGVTAVVPYVEAQLADGSWQRVVDDMGFPAGLARTMVADLTGKLSPGTRRIRIVTNLKVYWDQILIDTTPAGTPHRITEAPLAAAAAGYLGYPREMRGTPASDIRYDYHSVSATGPYARAAGYYTRYGDVQALVADADDRFVILGSGDEVAVEFDAAALPPLPAGWTRDWFFYVDGFAKDMDFYAAHPFTVTPLPYHAMPGYPYPAQRPYPDRGQHLEDQLELNTRAVSGRAAPSYRFSYRK